MKNRFETTDLYTASYIYCKGEEFIGLKPQGSAYLFVFSNKNKCLSLVNQYLQNKGNINAKAYSEATKTLKGLVFSKKTNTDNNLNFNDKNI